MTWWQIAIIAWLVLGAVAGIVIESCEAVQRRPSSYFDAVGAGALAAPLAIAFAGCFVFEWRTERMKRRNDAIESDYRETLALIDWTPKTRTALDDVVDELDIEVGRSSGGGGEGGVGGTTT